MAMFISRSVEETIAFGRERARALRGGDILALSGDLGAGKTHFVKGLVAGLGSSMVVTSPTFTLIHEYRGGRLPLYHFDFYRLENEAAVDRLGLEEYFFARGISVVEWADRFPDVIPSGAEWICFEMRSTDERVIRTKIHS
jgi:tRNA threonylcarbamoyladenosine biosynthesis protein TsaE